MSKSPHVKPILFSAPMVRALIEGRKTQTRRLHGGNLLPRVKQPTVVTGADYRGTFAGIVQSNCEECGNCGDECPCDRIVEELIAAVKRIDEEVISVRALTAGDA